MGQRHQVFLIARVVPNGSADPRYRCIAGYHHQWCSPWLSLRAARRCITAIQQEDNAQIIREEIRSIDRQYGMFGHAPELPHIPCPFASYLLWVNWDMDFALGPYDSTIFSGAAHEQCVVGAHLDCWDCDNDTGITVIDVSEPAAPRCCFLSPNSHPLDGTGYLEHYEDNLEERPEALRAIYARAIKDLEGVPLVSFDALVEAWPKSFVDYLKGSQENLDHDSGISRDISKERPTGSKASDPNDVRLSSGPARGTSVVLSLASMALHEAISLGLRNGDTRLIEESLWLPGRADIVRQSNFEQLRTEDSAPALRLLTKLVEHDVEHLHGVIDLAGVQVSDHQLAMVTCNQLDVFSLNLSRNHLITAAAVEQVLTALPNLKRILLIDCPAVTSEGLCALLDAKPHLFYKLEALVHPSLMSLSDRATWRPRITFLASESYQCYGGVSLPFFSPAAVVQGLDDLFAAISRASDGPGDVRRHVSEALTVAFTAAARRKAEHSWYQRSIVAAPILNPNYKRPRAGDWLFVLALPGQWILDQCGWAFLRLLPSWPVESEARAARAANETANPTAVTTRSSGHNTGNDDKASLAPLPSGSRGVANKPVLDFEVYGLRDWLEFVVQEGRPAVSEAALRHAEAAMSRICESFSIEGFAWTEVFKCPLMTRGVAAYHLQEIFTNHNVNGPKLTEEDYKIRQGTRIYK